MVESKTSWKNREQLVPVGREAFHYVGHVSRRGGADNPKMFSQFRKFNFLSIQHNGGDQLGVFDKFSIFILGEHHKFSLVGDQLDLVLVAVLDSEVKKKVEVDDVIGEKYRIISQRDVRDDDVSDGDSQPGVLCYCGLLIVVQFVLV